VTVLALFLVQIAALLGIALAAVGVARRPAATTWVYGAGLALSLIGAAAALGALVGATTTTAILPLGIPWLGMHLRLDPLAAFFLLIVDLGGAAASLYALGYGRHEPEPWRVLPFVPAFLAAMHVVVLADDAFTFLLAWEMMSLLSWALVLAHHRDEANARAGYVYLVMASFGTLALLLAFGVLAGGSGGYGFDAMRGLAHDGFATVLVLALALLGCGSKAGLIPLHVWLPLAHPAAPSHVSALMSGVMTKVAVYGFVRIVFDLLNDPVWWSSLLVLALGGLTAVLGILYALLERDLKRILAYSTIENVGIVFTGLGLALAFAANGLAEAAALAFTAALFHALNHSLFKGLLFMGAGAVLTATGSRDLERLGGLIHRMPATAVLMLVGSVAIAALPPFNGFASEWLLFQAIVESPDLPQWGLKVAVPAVGGVMALTAALAAACFVRAFGIAFLGRARSAEAAAAGEVDRASILAMGMLAALCLLLGLLPGLVIDLTAPIAQQVLAARLPTQLQQTWLTIVPIAESRSSYNGLLVFLFIVFSATLAVLIAKRLGNPALRRGPAWGCGFTDVGPAAQYTASSLAQPIRRVFGSFAFGAREHVEMPEPGSVEPARFAVDMHDPVWDRLYAPIAGMVSGVSLRLNVLQFLTIRRYLGLVFGSLVLLLLALSIWS
jgi:formate hydrogenlyase subunit 3/multisubunit Na+/H+ antiporter MnhD subunit